MGLWAAPWRLCGDEEAAAQSTRAAVRIAKELVALTPRKVTGDSNSPSTVVCWVASLVAAAGLTRLPAQITRPYKYLPSSWRWMEPTWRGVESLARAQVESARLHLATGNTTEAENLLSN